MNSAERYYFADFTRQNYARLLGIAKRTYRFRRFWDFDRGERFVLWRHDVDFSPQAAVKLAELEHAASVVATYFVSFHSDFYNLLERDVTHCIRRIAVLGHDIGLHLDPDYDGLNDIRTLEAVLRREAGWLGAVVGADACRAFSFHNPGPEIARLCAFEYGGLVNAAAEYFYGHVSFCSDSNGIWKDRRLEDVLTAAEDARLQVLTHPEMWQDAPMSPRQRAYRCIDGRAASTRRRYDDLLKAHGRPNID